MSKVIIVVLILSLILANTYTCIWLCSQMCCLYIRFHKLLKHSFISFICSVSNLTCQCYLVLHISVKYLHSLSWGSRYYRNVLGKDGKKIPKNTKEWKILDLKKIFILHQNIGQYDTLCFNFNCSWHINVKNFTVLTFLRCEACQFWGIPSNLPLCISKEE